MLLTAHSLISSTPRRKVCRTRPHLHAQLLVPKEKDRIERDTMAMEVDYDQTSSPAKGMGDMPEPSWSTPAIRQRSYQHFVPSSPPTDVQVVGQLFDSFNAHKVILRKSAVFNQYLEEYPNTTVLFVEDRGRPGTVQLIQYLYTGRLPHHQCRIGSHHYAAFTLYFAADAHNLPEMKQQARAQLLNPDVGLISNGIRYTVANYYYYNNDQVGIEQLRKEVVYAHAFSWHDQFSRDTVEGMDIMKELMHEYPAFSQDYVEGVTRHLETVKAMLEEQDAHFATLDAERALGRMTL